MWFQTLSNRRLSMYTCVANNSVGSSESPSVSNTVNGNHELRFFFFSPFRRSLSSWRTRERLCLHQVKSLLTVHWMPLAENFAPRPNRCELGTAGSVLTIGLSINECLDSKKPENKIDLCRSSGCGDFKGLTRFRQSLLKISYIIKKWKGGSSRRMTCFTCM